MTYSDSTQNYEPLSNLGANVYSNSSTGEQEYNHLDKGREVSGTTLFPLRKVGELSKFCTIFIPYTNGVGRDYTFIDSRNIVDHINTVLDRTFLTKIDAFYKLLEDWNKEGQYQISGNDLDQTRKYYKKLIDAQNEGFQFTVYDGTFPNITERIRNQNFIVTNSFENNLDSVVTDPLITELETFYGLGEDWDGEGALAIPDEAIDQAKKFLAAIINGSYTEPSGVAPSPDGEVLLFWRTDDEYIEANFYRDGGCIVCFRSDGQMLAIEDEKVLSIQESNTFREITKKLQEFSTNHS